MTISKSLLMLAVLSIGPALFGQATTCTPLTNSRFIPGATVVLYNMSTTPASIMYKFVLHSDCSISGVGNSNVSGSYSFAGNANMSVSINIDNGTTLSNLTIGFYMISSTNVGNFLFPQIVQTTLTEATGQVTKQSMSPYSPDGSGAGFQLAVFPDGFPKTAPLVSLPNLKAKDNAPAKKK